MQCLPGRVCTASDHSGFIKRHANQSTCEHNNRNDAHYNVTQNHTKRTDALDQSWEGEDLFPEKEGTAGGLLSGEQTQVVCLTSLFVLLAS